MRTLQIEGWIKALSPIQHAGDEKTGSTPILRAMELWSEREGRHVRVPFLSGNAIRGYLRRLVMRDLLQRINYDVQHPKLHYALFSGGTLTSTDDGGVVDLQARRMIRQTVPPLELFGTVVGNQMIDSCLKVDHALPVCLECAEYLRHADDPRAQHSVRTFTQFSFSSRRDDLRVEREEGEQAVQMLIEFEAFVAGALFEHGFALIYPSELAVSCLGHVLTLWAEQPYVGGKSGSGYGRISFDYQPFPDPQPYCDYVASHANEIAVVLNLIAEAL